MNNNNFLGITICFLFLIILSSCSPHSSIIYIGGLRNTEFQDSAFLVDGVFFDDLSGGALLKEVTIQPGVHIFTFMAKNGRRKDLKINVPSGENGLEYDYNKKLWLWNFKYYPDSDGALALIE